MPPNFDKRTPVTENNEDVLMVDDDSTQAEVSHTSSSSDPDDELIKAATTVFKCIANSVESRRNRLTKELDGDVAFANFVVSRLQQIPDRNIRLQVEKVIIECLYDAIKKCNK